jgi:hypothetical protein
MVVLVVGLNDFRVKNIHVMGVIDICRNSYEFVAAL